MLSERDSGINKNLRIKYTVQLLRDLIKAAKGELKSDLIIKGANLVDVALGDIREGVNIAIWSDFIVRVGYFDINRYVGNNTLIIDASKAEVVVPGFIDPHIHIESSMLTVQEFSKLVLKHGTTTVAADPHELANVMGIEGVKLFIEESKYTPLRVFFYAPSCVPPTSSGLDTPGAVLTNEDVKELLSYDEVIGLGEVMDFLGIYNCDEELLRKVVHAKRLGKLVDGHAPQLPEEYLVPYAVTRIEGDHESVFIDEALTKLRNGFRILIREGSAWRDLEELTKALTYMRINPRYLTFASDDLDVLELISEGHVDRILRRAVSLGIDPITAVQMATINAAEYLGIHKEVGSVVPGKFADIVILKDFRHFIVKDVIVGGKLVVINGEYVFSDTGKFRYPREAYETMNVGKTIASDDLLLKVNVNTGKAKVRVIRAIPGKAVTKCEIAYVDVVNGKLVIRGDSDLLYVATIERHHATGNIGRGFVCGLGKLNGAIAQSIAHDVHNIVTVGRSPTEMATAVNEVIKMGGGMVAVSAGGVIAKVPLPIAGLMSDKSYDELASELSNYIDALKVLGVNYRAIFMTIALLPLPVIPEVRITDKGLVDVLNGKLIDPIVSIE